MSESALPLYRQSFDWEQYCRDYPMPDVFERTVYAVAARTPALAAERALHALRAGRLEEPVLPPALERRGSRAGRHRVARRHCKACPTFNSDDIKASVDAFPPFGDIQDVDRARLGFDAVQAADERRHRRERLAARSSDPMRWETQALSTARAMWIQGARPATSCRFR
jgi:hypothetical protein